MSKKPKNFCNFARKSDSVMLGRLVKSTAGRDCGRFFVVIGEMDEKYILLADGDLRQMDSPKIKKVKHVECLELVSESLKQRLLEGTTIQNAELKKIIISLSEQL